MSGGFLAVVANARNDARDFDRFVTIVKDLEETQGIINAIHERTQKWGVTCGLTVGKKKAVVESLSEKELEWKKYFEDHSFPDTESQRNLADALSILAGIELSRFIRIIKPAKERFPKYVCIVPTANRNDHSYKLGNAIFNFSSGTTFYTNTGASGNQMSARIDTFRLSTREEIEGLLMFLLYRMSSAAENLYYGLILDPDTSEER